MKRNPKIGEENALVSAKLVIQQALDDLKKSVPPSKPLSPSFEVQGKGILTRDSILVVHLVIGRGDRRLSVANFPFHLRALDAGPAPIANAFYPILLSLVHAFQMGEISGMVLAKVDVARNLAQFVKSRLEDFDDQTKKPGYEDAMFDLLALGRKEGWLVTTEEDGGNVEAS